MANLIYVILLITYLIDKEEDLNLKVFNMIGEISVPNNW